MGTIVEVIKRIKNKKTFDLIGLFVLFYDFDVVFKASLFLFGSWKKEGRVSVNIIVELEKYPVPTVRC